MSKHERKPIPTCPRTHRVDSDSTPGGSAAARTFTLTLADVEDVGIVAIRFAVTDALGRYNRARDINISFVDYGDESTLRRAPIIPPSIAVISIIREHTPPLLVPQSVSNSRRQQVRVEIGTGLAGDSWFFWLQTARKTNGIWTTGEVKAKP